MGDTTTLFVVEVAEVWHHTGDGAALRARWPAVARALGWLLANANATGLPHRLETTYDHFGFGSRDTVAYNAFVYMTALAAAGEMAAAMGDAPLEASAVAALAAARAAAKALLWNATAGYFRAFVGGDAVFTDTLYGLMVGHAHGFGLLMDVPLVAAHLALEWERNKDAFGMRVISNPIMEDSIWMNGPPTWTYISLLLAGPVPSAAAAAAALEPMRRMVANYRERLADLWNLRALTHSETEGGALEHGGPREQGHYGFMLTDQNLYYLLSGQQTALHRGRLSFAPPFPPPWTLPVLLRGTEGALSADAGGRFSLRVEFGRLFVPAGGLSVNGRAFAGEVDLGPGQNVSW
jgi:hypothetical protein